MYMLFLQFAEQVFDKNNWFDNFGIPGDVDYKQNTGFQRISLHFNG